MINQDEKHDYIVPGEYRLADDEIEINAGRKTKTIRVANTGDRPIQVGSHYHFVEANPQLSFDRKETAGMRLNIAAGTAVRFEPGEEKEVELTELGGKRIIYGFWDVTNGSVENVDEIMEKEKALGFKGAGN